LLIYTASLFKWWDSFANPLGGA